MGNKPSNRDRGKVVLAPEDVIGRAVRHSRARADRHFTGPVGIGPEIQDLTSVPVRDRSKAFKVGEYLFRVPIEETRKI